MDLFLIVLPILKRLLEVGEDVYVPPSRAGLFVGCFISIDVSGDILEARESFHFLFRAFHFP